MARPYLVIPEGTTIYEVVASSPKYAASKVRHGKGVPLEVRVASVIPHARCHELDPAESVIPGQLTLVDAA